VQVAVDVANDPGGEGKVEDGITVIGEVWGYGVEKLMDLGRIEARDGDACAKFVDFLGKEAQKWKKVLLKMGDNRRVGHASEQVFFRNLRVVLAPKSSM
jgi:hypothetical protein